MATSRAPALSDSARVRIPVILETDHYVSRDSRGSRFSASTSRDRMRAVIDVAWRSSAAVDDAGALRHERTPGKPCRFRLTAHVLGERRPLGTTPGGGWW